MQIRFRFDAAKADPEKLVLPGLVFVQRTLGDFSGFNVAIGWWHWGLHMVVIWPCAVKL